MALNNMPDIADAWAVSGEIINEFHQGSMTSAELAALTAEFLARGGKIEEVPSGTLTAKEVPFNIHLSKDFTPEKASEHERRRKARIEKEDKPLVEKLNEWLDKGMSRHEIQDGLGVGYDKLQRLLRTYFEDDPRADAYRAVPKQDDQEADYTQYAALRETMEHAQACRAMHIGWTKGKTLMDLWLARMEKAHVERIKPMLDKGLGLREISKELRVPLQSLKRTILAYGLGHF